MQIVMLEPLSGLGGLAVSSENAQSPGSGAAIRPMPSH